LPYKIKKMKRNLFLLMSFITLVVPFVAIMIIFPPDANNWILGFILNISLLALVYTFYFLLHLLIVFLMYRFGVLHELPGLLFDIHLPFTGLYSWNFKRVYLSDCGYFWIKIKDSKVFVYKQNLLYIENKGYCYYNENLEVLKESISRHIRTLKNDETIRNNNKKKLDKIKDWNGCLDSQSERDHKLKKLLK
jgi:hypothetical protein